MRRWWREKDFSSVFNEKIITSDIDADSIVEMIYIWIQQMKDKGITNDKNRKSDND